LYYKYKTCWGEDPTDDDMLNWTPKDFKKYCSSKAYHDDYAANCLLPYHSLKPSPRVGIYGDIRGARNGSGVSSMACPVTKNDVCQVVKLEKTFYLNKEDEKYFNEWNNNVGVGTQIDHTHCVFNESLVPKDDGEKAILQKIQFLHTILEERLNTDPVHSLAHPHGEIYDTYTAYHRLKQHSLAFTREQLSHGILSQYIEAMQSPGKWSGTFFNVALHLHEQIKQYMWLKLIGLLPLQSFCLMQSAVDYIIRLEYVQQMDHREHTDRRVSSTYIDVLHFTGETYNMFTP
jgi:hypothetical protein